MWSPAGAVGESRVLALRMRRGSGAPGGRNAPRGLRDAGEVAGTAAPAGTSGCGQSIQRSSLLPFAAPGRRCCQ